MCPTLTVGSFFRRVKSPFCSFVQQFQNTRTSDRIENEKKKTKHAQNLESTLRIPPWPHFFRHLRLYLKFSGLHQRVSPSFVPIFCNTMHVKKSQRVRLLHFSALWHYSKITIKKFLGNFFKSSKAPPPFTILSLRYGADFGRSRLVFCLQK